MRGSILSLITVIILIGLFLYWLLPIETFEFTSGPINSNFSINGFDQETQFYSQMRFPESKISYKIEDCTIKKKQDAEQAFTILSNSTILEFYEGIKPEIIVTCDEKEKIEGGMFIAGEGGPTNITRTNNFNVIRSGKVLLIRDSKCPQPNVAIHELLHVLGFKHSTNKNNIMYNISKCKQEIGEDTIKQINQLYGFQSLPDMAFENVTASLNGKYLDAEISMRNHGLKISDTFKIKIYEQEKLIKELEIEPIEVGFGKVVSLQNIYVSRLRAETLDFIIDHPANELQKDNNVLSVQAVSIE